MVIISYSTKGGNMKIAPLLIFVIANSIAMDYTPPANIPAHLRERVQEMEPAKAESSNTDIKRTSSMHRVHDVDTIIGTIKNESGNDVVIEIKQDKLHESDTDESKVNVSKRILILSHGATAFITGLVGMGITLIVKYEACK
jgi:hypothetical protein